MVALTAITPPPPLHLGGEDGILNSQPLTLQLRVSVTSQHQWEPATRSRREQCFLHGVMPSPSASHSRHA